MVRWWAILGGSAILGMGLYLLAFIGMASGQIRPEQAFALGAIAFALGLGGMATFTWAMLFHCLQDDLPPGLRLAYLALIVGFMPLGALIYSLQRDRLSKTRSP